MYSADTINTLSQRIGYGEPFNDLGFTVASALRIGASSRTFAGFHKLATLDNIYLAVPKKDMLKADFEAYISAMRLNATKDILTRILDQHADYEDELNYDTIITKKLPLFETCLGYAVAIAILELLGTTERSNLATISADLSYAQLKLEINGFRNEEDELIAEGIDAKLEASILKAQNVIFGNSVGISSNGNLW